MSLIRRYGYSLLTFSVAFLIMMFAFVNEGLFPFGENQIMIIDSWHQYYPILQELQFKLQHGESLFYSWNTGTGTNFFVMMAYYAMSPLNFLSFFVPAEFLREFMLFATIGKIAFAGAFFTEYLRGVFKSKNLSIVLFGLMYAFSGFLMGYYWDIMWLDCVALLPLVILGLHRLMDEGKFGLFVFTLALSLISNFYIAYFVCEFIALYTFVVYFTKYRSKGITHFFNKISKVVMYSVLAIGSAMLTLLPIFIGMQRAYGLSSGNPTSFKLYHSILDILNNLLAYVEPTVVDGLPNISITMIGLLFMIFYFLVPGIPTKNKVINGSFAAFLILSMNINYLNFVWHGFHFPNQVPFRFSFLLSFVLLTIAYEAMTKLNELPVKAVLKVTGVMMVYLIVNEKLYTTLFDAQVFYISAAFLLAYASIVLLYKHDKVSIKFMAKMILIVLLVEITVSAFHATEVAGNSGRTDYPVQNSEVQAALDDLYAKDTGFYRLEMYQQYSANDPLLYGYRGITQFSSTANSKLNTFAKKMGMSADPGGNSNRYLPGTPVINAMFNIKYLLSKHAALPIPNAAYTKFNEFTDLEVYENRYAFPLGFKVNPDILNLTTTDISPFRRQEQFMSLATGNEVTFFKGVEAVNETYENMDRHLLEDIRYHYKNIDASKIGKAKIEFVAQQTKQMYIYMLNQTKTVTLKMNGVSTTHQTPRGVIIDLGIVEEGTSFELSFEVMASASGYFDIHVVTFDDEVFTVTRNDLIDEAFEVDEFTQTKLTGVATLNSDGLLYTSIPYEKGWKVKVDGDRIEPMAYQDAMIAIPLREGTHQIEFSYVSAGFVSGLMISVLSLLILASIYVLGRKTDFQKEQKELKSKRGQHEIAG
ncbi:MULTISPECIES: YfhO family protein [unclassified Fusibacter]|uniref:YfhO family protein n=1 Tax=unclassified Fusibacter TaxID=2624464 RepID=UPI0013E8FA9A|nr:MULTISPECIES: YfhO family protein [unclassified Fusibacter]MCK8061458.1 YfhO family protein [Fusibacter sp. A2]NPE23645.1 YfhO family protein [Fusibacter sp. A1]